MLRRVVISAGVSALGTFTAADLSTLDDAQLDAAIRANVGLFIRGYRS